MNKSKKLYILLGVLVVVCLGAFLVTRITEKKEQIAASGEVVLAIDPEDVTAFSWSNETGSQAFTKGDEGWQYDDDELFPVSEEAVTTLLETFEEFSAAFIIEDVDDFGQYGLDDPMCTIDVTTDEGTTTIELGDYSAMDSERYVSIGDGNVYLAVTDPYNNFSVERDYVMDNAEIPYYETVEKLTFTGEENYSIFYEEESGRTAYEDDTYFADMDGEILPVDTAHVDTYMYNIEYLSLTDYVKYGVTDDELSDYFLDDPDLTVTVDYSYINDDDSEYTGSFKVLIGWDPDERAQVLEEEAAAEDEDDDTSDETEEYAIYAMVEGTPIVYRISEDDYNSLMEVSYNNMRHREVVQADFEDIESIDISLDGKDYEILASEGKDDEITYTLDGEEIDIADIQSAIEELKAADAEAYTDEKHGSSEEIEVTVHLKEDAAGSDTGADIKVNIYTYDGSDCLVCVNGESFAFVERSLAVDLIEAVKAVVL